MQSSDLVKIFNMLPQSEQQTLFAFAEFLRDRSVTEVSIPTKQAIPRPDSESVIAAIKRLSKTYPMLEKSNMLNETSTLVTQHVIQGRDAIEVIDELEMIFQRQYDLHCAVKP